MTSKASEVIKANKEALEQGLVLLDKLTENQLSQVCEPWISSTIGQHIRHVVDMYFALAAAECKDIIDYDVRQRGSNIEKSLGDAKSAMHSVIDWLSQLEMKCQQGLELEECSLNIKSEVSLSRSVSLEVSSNLLRELVFVGSHAVHHYALIKVIAKCLEIDVEEWFGVAPATVSYLRNELACAQ